jgi:hypothetical protein
MSERLPCCSGYRTSDGSPVHSFSCNTHRAYASVSCHGGAGGSGAPQMKTLMQQAQDAARAQVLVLEKRTEQRIREIVREEIALWDDAQRVAAGIGRDTEPSPPPDPRCWCGSVNPSLCPRMGHLVPHVHDFATMGPRETCGECHRAQSASWSGADVVPRGGSEPPGYVVKVNTATGRAVTDAVLDVPGACVHCRMLACVCAHRSPFGDGSPGVVTVEHLSALETDRAFRNCYSHINPDNGHGAADGFGGSDYPDVTLFDNNEGGIDK